MPSFAKKVFSELGKNDISFYCILTVLAVAIGGGFVFSLVVQITCFALLSVSFSYIFIKKSFEDKYALLALLPLIAACVSYFGADFQANVRISLIGLINATAAFFIIIYANGRNKENAIVTLVILGLWVSLLMFMQTFSGSGDIDRTLALNVNIVAGFLLLVYPLCFGFIEKNKYPQLFMLLAFVIFAAIAFTKSRSVIFAAYAVTLFYLFRLGNKSGFKIFFFAVSAIVAAGLLWAFFYKMNWASLGDRLIWWKTALAMFKDYPLFGAGFGNYSALYLVYRPEFSLGTLFAHNTFIQLLAETGIFGALSFFAAGYGVVRNAFKNRAANAENPYAAAASLSLIAFLLVNIGDYSFLVPSNMLVFFVISGILYKTETSARKNKYVACLILIPLFFTIYVFSALLTAERYYEQGNLFYNARDYENAAKLYKKAAGADVKNPEYWHQIAETEFELSKLAENPEKKYEFILGAIDNDLRAEKLYKHSSQIKAGLAYLYKVSGNEERAKEYAGLAREYDKFNPLYRMR